MDKAQKAVLKGIGGLLVTMGLFYDDESTANMAFSGGAALLVSASIDLLSQNNDTGGGRLWPYT